MLTSISLPVPNSFSLSLSLSLSLSNLAQDVDEPWPIEVYAHDGKAYNVTMEVRKKLMKD